MFCALLIELNEMKVNLKNALSLRFESFAPERLGTAKWFVDGCDYLAAVGNAIVKVIINSPDVPSLIQFRSRRLLHYFSFLNSETSLQDKVYVFCQS